MKNCKLQGACIEMYSSAHMINFHCFDILCLMNTMHISEQICNQFMPMLKCDVYQIKNLE